MSPPDHYRDFMDDLDDVGEGRPRPDVGMSFDEIYSLLDAVPAREAGRVEDQLERINRQLERRDEIHERNVEEIQNELEELEEERHFVVKESFYRRKDRREAEQRLNREIAELRQELRRRRHSKWENHQKLRREKREVLRELEEVEESEELIGTYLDQV